jgi:AhpD family alkylhydroperoxidase
MCVLRSNVFVFLVALVGMNGSFMSAVAQDNVPKAVPQNRAEILKAVERLKLRQPRLPMPAVETTDPAIVIPNHSGLGGGIVNNARMRNKYLPPEFHHNPNVQSQGSPDQSQPDFGLPTEFSVQLFWIVSRLNNCHYCLGHQETKLKSAGVTEESLLALDTNWSAFSDKQQVAFAFTKKLTYAPYSIGDDDVAELKKHFSDQQILEMTFLVGRYNSTNRWTDSLGIPQEDHREYSSGLESKALQVESTTAIDVFPERTQFTDWASWDKASKEALQRHPRVFFKGMEDKGRAPHLSLLATILGAKSTREQLDKVDSVGSLPLETRRYIAYVAARDDHAWYMQHVVHQQLRDGGMTDSAIFALASDSPGVSKLNVAAIAFARKLTCQPQRITDADVESLKQHFTAEQIAEIVYHVGIAAMLNRVTEVAGISPP